MDQNVEATPESMNQELLTELSRLEAREQPGSSRLGAYHGDTGTALPQDSLGSESTSEQKTTSDTNAHVRAGAKGFVPSLL